MRLVRVCRTKWPRLAFALMCAFSLGLAGEGPPEWAYGTQPLAAATNREPKPSATAGSDLLHLPGSKLGFTKAQIGDRFGPADWYPGDHPTMPPVVANGRKPEIWACSMCHYPNGKGRPENAGIAGLPTSYFVHQMHDFRNGLRTSADARKKNTNIMISIAKAMTDDEIEAAADYFGALRWTPWIKVVETHSVPKTRISAGMYLPLEGSGREPLGKRIIEVPKDAEATEKLRDPRSGFIAYVPVGSIAKGEVLVTGAVDRTTSCLACHGSDLKGMGPVPGIAGRSPSYLVRQMYDMQQGTRKGEWTDLMKPVVSQLSNEDMLNIAAYCASRQ